MAPKTKQSEYVTVEELEMEGRYALAQRLLVLLSVSGLLLGSLFGILGIVLVYLGATGNTNVNLFGQSVSTGSVGIAAIFIAAATFVTVVTRILKAFNNLILIGAGRKL